MRRAKDRVVGLLSSFRSLQALKEPDAWIQVSLTEAVWLASTLMNNINEILKNYPFYFAVPPPKKEDKELFVPTICRFGPAAKSLEHKAVETIVLGMMRGWLYRIRRCQQCGVWFFARKDWQKFDQAKCRKRHARKKEGQREQQVIKESYAVRRCGLGTNRARKGD